ncbi:MAG: GNAT family N-acetyltransferase [Pseudomonadota bacterium]
MDRIFFDAALRTTFDSQTDRETFRERWLGRYIRDEAQEDLAAYASIAVADNGSVAVVAGYVVGSLLDPNCDPRFGDVTDFADVPNLTAKYPAHLHINLVASVRGHGVGQRLVRRIASQAYAFGAPGLHVVTGATSRNLLFYNRLGLRPVSPDDWKARGIVMLASRLPLRVGRPA